jgi:hypothetical protein
MQVLSSAGSAIAGANAKNFSEEQAQALLAQARDEFGKIDLPTLEQLAGEALPPTELAKIKTDPRLQQAQYAALDKLGDYSQGGMTLQDQSTLNAAMGKVSRTEGAGRNAIQENMAARGTLGSGAELAMSMNNQQAAANRANSAGLDVAGRAQERALDAIMKRGELGGRMREQDYREQSRKAEAQDIINKYNGTRKANAYGSDFRNKMELTRAKNGMTGGIADSILRQGQNNANMAGGVGSAINQGAGAFGNYLNTAPTQPATGPYPEDEPLSAPISLDPDDEFRR